jgi:hypothetical protein
MAGPLGILHTIARFQRGVVEELEDAFLLSVEDPAFRAVYEAELGLPPGSLENAQVPPSPTALHAFIDDEEADLERFANAVEDMVRYIQAWGSLIAAAVDEDTDRVVDELLYRAFEISLLNHVKYRRPTFWWLLRIFGYVVTETRVHSFERLDFDNVGASFERSGAYFRDLYASLVHGIALPAPASPCPPDVVEQPPDEPTEDERIVARHTAEAVTYWSDLVFLLLTVAPHLPRLEDHLTTIYGWENDPGSTTPVADRISNRALTLAVAAKQTETSPATRLLATLLLHPDSEGGAGGWFASLRGDLKVEQKLGEKGDPDPWKLTTKFFAPDGVEVLAFDGVTVFGDPTFAVEVGLKREPGAEPAAVLPEGSGTRLEFGKASFGLELNSAKAGIKARSENSALVLVPKDGDSFLAKVLTSKELRLRFDLGLALDTDDGLHLDGGAALTTTLAVGKSLGPVKVQTIELGVRPKEGKLGIRVTSALSVKLGAVTFSLAGIGFRFALGAGGSTGDVPEEGITLLPRIYLDGSPGFEPPNGVGVKIDSGVVTGGGFLFYDRSNRQYAGALEVRFRKWTLKAVGLLAPAPPGATIGFSLLVLVFADDFGGAGLGLRLTGVGGLLGLNHRSDVDALRAGLKTRTLDSVLFPKDPVGDAPRIVQNLRTVFPPAADQFLVGLMAKFEWPAPTLFTGEIGLVLELPSPTRVLILGQLHGAIPFPDKPPVRINLDLLGVIDGDGFALDATLYDSSVIGFALSGDGALRVRGGDNPLWLCSLGGFHPRFAPPPGFPRLDRLAVHFAEGKNLRMRAEAYLAVTSNTFQFGAKLELYVGFAGFSLEGRLGFDALFQRETPELVALVEAGIAFKWHGLSLFGVHLTMTISGFTPWHFEGKVTFEVFGFSKSKSFDETCGDEAPPRELPEVDPLPALVAALREPRNWQTALPPQTQMLATLRAGQPEDGIRVHPLGRIGVRQTVVPLNLDLDHVGGARLRGDRRFSLGHVMVDGKLVTQLDTATDLFAPAQFLALSDAQKLTRPSFEPMPAGFDLASGGIAFGAPDQAAVTDLEYETCIMGADGRCLAYESEPHRPDPTLVTLVAEIGPAANAELRRDGAARYITDGPVVRVEPPAFAVASAADLEGPAATFTSYSAAWQAMRRDRAPGMQVVAEFEREPA